MMNPTELTASPPRHACSRLSPTVLLVEHEAALRHLLACQLEALLPNTDRSQGPA